MSDIITGKKKIEKFLQGDCAKQCFFVCRVAGVGEETELTGVLECPVVGLVRPVGQVGRGGWYAVYQLTTIKPARGGDTADW